MNSYVYAALFCCIVVLWTQAGVIYPMVVPYVFAAFEKNVVPDFIIRIGIRQLLADRLHEIGRPNTESQQESLQQFVEQLKTLPIAIATADANEQHYEVSADFYQAVLGKHLKYSSALYPAGSAVADAARLLDAAEADMLDLYMQRANVTDSGLHILDMGCGWGSVSLYVAAKFPSCTVTGLSNSNSQREFIMGEAAKRGINNLQILTGDINSFEMPSSVSKFDRVISIEMLEHMKNYQKLLGKVSSWMKPGGLMFVHIFVHRLAAYHFEVSGEDDWMAKYFFTGGTMPSADLLFYFQEQLSLLKHWHVQGTHYGMTSEAWLQKLDMNADQLLPVFAKVYGEGQEIKWLARWRGFFLACAELFNYNGGNEWFVAHYLFQVTLM